MNKKVSQLIMLVLAAVSTFVLGSFLNVYALSNPLSQIASNQRETQPQAFTDNFDSFNSSVWTSGYMWGANDINMGNANPANISILSDANGSYLCLSSPQQNNIGAVTSVDQFGYGTYTSRMKFTASNGTWPSFWALNGPTSWEIDGHESLGNDPSVYYMTLHYYGDVGQGLYNNQGSLADQWHTYSYTWTPTDVTFYFDGIMKYSQTYSKPDLMNVTFTMGIMGNGIIWNGNRYDSTTFANGTPTLCVDYFSYTPLAANPSATPSAMPSVIPSTIPSITPTVIPSVTPSAAPSATPSQPIEAVHDDKDNGFVYSSGWQDITKKQAYKGSYKQTTRNGSFATYVFTGQSFSVLYEGGPSFRTMDVYVDDVLVGTINEKAKSSAFQRRWDLPGPLASGSHTVKLVFVTPTITNNTTGSLDAITIRP